MSEFLSKADLVRYTKSFPKPRALPCSVLDRIADEEYKRKVTGGYRKSDPVCKKCFCKINKAGTCNCE